MIIVICEKKYTYNVLCSHWHLLFAENYPSPNKGGSKVRKPKKREEADDKKILEKIEGQKFHNWQYAINFWWGMGQKTLQRKLN